MSGIQRMKRTGNQWRGGGILGILATVLVDPTSSCATFPYIGQSEKEILMATYGTPADPCSAGGGEG